MKKITVFIILFIFTSKFTFAQHAKWKLLPNSPIVGATTRHDDLYFVNDSTGWLVNGDGEIWHTEDFGNSWVRQLLFSTYFRSVEFINDSVGFAGTLDDFFFQTTDRGIHWNRIEDRFPAMVKGICGMSHIGNTLYGVGIWSSPAHVIKTTDAGVTWSFTDMSFIAGSLVDCWFLNQDTGFVSGRSIGAVPTGIILKTVNGGQTWNGVYLTTGANEYVWKLQFQNDLEGFASIQSLQGMPSRILKTIDGGNTWSEKIVTAGSIMMQGTAFLNDSIGWCGGWSNGLYQSNDGGTTWAYQNIGMNFNRFFKVREGLAYGCGTQVYKFSLDNIDTITIPESTTPDPIHSLKFTPNPLTDISTIECRIDKETYCILYLVDALGRRIHTYIDGFKEKGTYNFSVNKNALSSGEYMLIMQTNERYFNMKIQVLK